MKNSLFALMLVLFGTSFISSAQGYKVGDLVNDFSLLNIDGTKISLNRDDEKMKGVILIFTCNHCPFSIAYEDRIIDLDRKYSELGFPVIAINSNDAIQYPDDSYEAMIARANEKEFKFPYLHDETQEVAKRFGATKTPHVFVLVRKGAEFEVKYIGAIDDNSETPEKVNSKYVEEAVNLLLENKAVKVPVTKAIGCSIKWKK